MPATASSARSSRAVLPGSSETLHQDSELERPFGDCRRRQCLVGRSSLVGHAAAIGQRAGVFGSDREIDVFGDRPCPFDDAQTVELGNNNAGHGAARVEKGLPLFPGCTGAVIAAHAGRHAGPLASLLTIPAVTLGCELKRPWSGKPTTTTASPGLIGLSPRTNAASATGSGKRRIARSAVGSVATTVATPALSFRSTRNSRQASTTWWLVRTSPVRLTINPEPPELSRSPLGDRLAKRRGAASPSSGPRLPGVQDRGATPAASISGRFSA